MAFELDAPYQTDAASLSYQVERDLDELRLVSRSRWLVGEAVEGRRRAPEQSALPDSNAAIGTV